MDHNDLVIEGGVYSLAFVSLIDAKKANPNQEDKKYLTHIPMTYKEMSALYSGAILVGGFQIILILIIISEMTSKDFKLVHAKSFNIIVPRLLSSLMMHLIVEKDIRQGLRIMKYVVNHP